MVSIVIPAFNEERYIADCLESLVRQKTTKKFEVIVVDNSSTDNTVKVLQKYKDKLDLKIVSEKKKGRGAARGTGFRTARGELIFSTDADTIVPIDWIDVLSSHFKKENIIAVTGTCRIEDCSWITNIFLNAFQPRIMLLYRLIFGYYWLSGFNSAIRKSVYRESGGFNPNLNAHEDIELGLKVKNIGDVYFFNNLPVVVSGRRFKEGIIKTTLSYVKTMVDYSLLRKRTAYLEDVR